MRAFWAWQWVLGLVGLGLVALGYFGHIEIPYLGGMRVPWDGMGLTLTENTRRVCRVIGLLLLAVALLLCVLAGVGGGI